MRDVSENAIAGAAERPGQFWSRAISLRAHLNLFSLAVLLPLWLVLALGAWNYAQQIRQGYEQQTLLLARKLATDLDHQLSGLSGTLAALATSPALLDGDYARFHDQALQAVSDGTAIVVRDRSGQQLVNTLWPLGTKLPVTQSDTVKSADACVVRTGRVCASDLYVGTTDQQPYVLLDAPVRRHGTIDLLIDAGMRARYLGDLLQNSLVPPDWTASILDQQNRIIARSREHDRFVGHVAPAEVVRHAPGQEGTFESVTVEGTPVWAAYVRLPNWGWRVAVGVPQSVLRTPLHYSILFMGVTGTLAAGLSALISTLYGRRLVAAVTALRAMAVNMDRAADGPVSTSVREVNDVAEGLSEAALQLRASLAERDLTQARLERLNHELEDRVQAEVAAREDAQARAAQAQRMQALGQLAGGIAHDFNNVLQAAAGAAALLKQRLDKPDAVGRFADLILNAAARGTSVTHRLLAFARPNDLKAEPLDLKVVLVDLHELLAPTLGSPIDVHVTVPPDLPLVSADRGQLETVLVNLATNSRDAMPNGGTLSFAAAVETVTAPSIHAARLQVGQYVRLTVADTGIGMDAPTVALATEPFFTTKGSGHGNGLGLPMARGFAERSGGGLLIKSQPDEGTMVTLWLPVAEQSVAADAAEVSAPNGTPAVVGGRRRVLLVDDEDIVREVLALQLEDAGYEVIAAASADDALSVLGQGFQPDALVTDLRMPGMNGIELIQVLRKRGMRLPAILITGNDADNPVIQAEGMGQDFSLLHKPVPAAALADKIATLTGAA
ncbi:MAG: response regulator [Proteobacteria bacterium]|nr:response regulator [Pseudomonadota bacterium]